MEYGPLASRSGCSCAPCTEALIVQVHLVDWVEHALETGAEPYLYTPEEELPFVERYNLDIFACFALGYYIAFGIVSFRTLDRWMIKLSRAVSALLNQLWAAHTGTLISVCS